MQIDLTHRVVLVTGARRGIGRALAERLAEAGATVGVHHSGREAAEAEGFAGRLGNGSRALAADLFDRAAPSALWAAALEAFGRVDGLVNNAGVFEEAPLDGLDADWRGAWERTLTVNLWAAAVLCRAACLHAERRQQDAPGVAVRIVNVSSRAAFRGDDPEFLAYAASKGGLESVTKSIARGWGRRGVVAFGVAPGFTRTDMAAGAIAQQGEAGVAAGMALDRLTEPDDIAPLVTLLLSGLADHATGTTVDVNGASHVR